MLGGGIHDKDYSYRSRLFHLAIEAGVGLERHYRGANSTSEILLGTRSLVQACDDHMILRSMVEATSYQQGLRVDFKGMTSRSVWNFVKGQEPMLEGSRGFGLSDLGWFAVGGILKHATTLDAIAISTAWSGISWDFRLPRIVSDRDKASLVAIEPMSGDPRYRSIVHRSMPVYSCPYLVLSSIAMAMLDGITQKIAPATGLNGTQEDSSLPQQSGMELAEFLNEDSGFLMHAEVFSEPLIQSLCQRLSNTTN